MAVYTDVAAEELAEFLKGYDIGELLSYKGIAEGVENSNFLMHTSKGAYILTETVADRLLDGWPLPASVVISMMCRRIALALSLSSSRPSFFASTATGCPSSLRGRTRPPRPGRRGGRGGRTRNR